METTVAQKPTTTYRMGTPLLASRGSRLMAAIVDSVVVFLIYLAAIMIDSPEILLLGVSLFAILQVYLLSVDGQTVGKKAVGIKIVTVEGNTNGGFVTNVLMRSILNSLIAIVPFYALVDVLFIFREDQRCIHDLIAGTRVIKA